ncbi:hypothetical protein EVAR_52851_1 [Eumeta japonica]|uniref:Uncharacterized protein n=1 Tax=Eumeta variegata TaxID=151549 RepID=A0A4C1YG58_EUMVA|nr:hypothetical protein EVAR_52851_1 [Eumeta japonica]
MKIAAEAVTSTPYSVGGRHLTGQEPHCSADARGGTAEGEAGRGWARINRDATDATSRPNIFSSARRKRNRDTKPTSADDRSAICLTLP